MIFVTTRHVFSLFQITNYKIVLVYYELFIYNLPKKYFDILGLFFEFLIKYLITLKIKIVKLFIQGFIPNLKCKK